MHNKINNYDHFILVQDNPFEGGFNNAMEEVRSGKKSGHWIWYIFPQLRRLATSRKGVFYGLRNRSDALGYISHRVLGQRLRNISEVLLLHEGKSPVAIFGERDAEKVRSCMTLFEDVSGEEVFTHVLDSMYGGERCKVTLELLCREKNPRIEGPFIIDGKKNTDKIVEQNFPDREFDIILDKEDYYNFRDKVDSVKALVVSTNNFSSDFLNAVAEGYEELKSVCLAGLLVCMVNGAKDRHHFVDVYMDDLQRLFELLGEDKAKLPLGINRNFQSVPCEEPKLTLTIIAGYRNEQILF